MRTNKYADLIRFGFKQKTLMTLSESDVNKLHRNLIEGNKKNVREQITTKLEPQRKVTTIGQTTAKTTGVNIGPIDVSMDQSGNVVVKGPVNSGKEKKKSEKVIKDGEVREDKNKKSKYSDINPWAVCHSQLGPKKTPKFERCVKAIKQSIKEGKNPFDFLLENKILSLLEQHLRPKMKKGDLLNLIGKKSMNLPIGKIGGFGGKVSEDTKTKPTTKPGTKTPPKPDKDSPYKPKTKTPPKASGETKEAVMDTKTKPTTKPGTKTPPKPDKDSPYKPKTVPKPKAGRKTMPSWMSFDAIGIKLKK